MSMSAASDHQTDDTVNSGAPLEADREQIRAFVTALFVHAECGGFISLRAFEDTKKTALPFAIATVELNGSLDPVIDTATTLATSAAQAEHPVVFCPPIATFFDYRATQKNL